MPDEVAGRNGPTLRAAVSDVISGARVAPEKVSTLRVSSMYCRIFGGCLFNAELKTHTHCLTAHTSVKWSDRMEYQDAQQQITQIQQQAQDVKDRLQQFAQKLSTSVGDQNVARELAMDLREIALGVQQQQQQTQFVLQQMGQHIQQLEQAVEQHPPAMQYAQPRGWGAGSGFLGNLTAGLGLGAGIGVGEDVANDLFNLF
ncbi:hypothetical protein [Acidihalobacter ferrooxydans]|nr:hypothetical protein [Acidihalobacter ferrooxydans]